MDLTGIGTAATAVKDILGMFLPDKTEQEKAQLAATLTLAMGQQDTNRVEAGSASVFVAGWRPAVGWVCACALAMVYIPKALVLTIVWTYQAFVIVSAWKGVGVPPTLPAYPDMGVADLLGLLASLLGMGAMRMTETLNGKARATIGTPNDSP